MTSDQELVARLREARDSKGLARDPFDEALNELSERLGRYEGALTEIARLLDEEACGCDVPDEVRRAWDDYYKGLPNPPFLATVFSMEEALAQEKAWELALAALTPPEPEKETG